MNRKIDVRFLINGDVGLEVFNATTWRLLDGGGLDVYALDASGMTEKVACFAPGGWFQVSFQDK